jgi:hypothetical protein
MSLTTPPAGSRSVNHPKSKKLPSEGRLAFEPLPDGRRLTHQAFRFPAKLHPPAVHHLIAGYSEPGDRVFDPFCGSGTVLVEASTMDRNVLGIDVDPLAVFLTNVKTSVLDVDRLRQYSTCLSDELAHVRRDDEEYKRRQFDDLDDRALARELGDLVAPAIPKLDHWFRRYVTVDLARMRATIDGLACSPDERNFFLLVFASIIRGSSNADPVPVSGLEVTRHMRERAAAGRVINPFALFERKLSKGLDDFEQYSHARSADVQCAAMEADAITLTSRVRGSIDVVVTSPPYHGAVDYYRRHQLEMYWLGLTAHHEQRLGLLNRYLGRAKVAARHPLLQSREELPPMAVRTEAAMRDIHPARADAFVHYCVGMQRTMAGLAARMKPRAPVVMVVGHSRWNGQQLDTSTLMSELARPHFTLDDRWWYPAKNRHMSYGRHNGADIDREHVLVFRRV